MTQPQQATSPQKARCLNCRTEILVPASYAQGDHVPCGTCGTQHKVVRGDVLRLVLADVSGLRDALRGANERVERLEAELRAARGSFGIGANGLGFGVIYILWQIALKETEWHLGLVWEAAGVAVVSGALLETANYFFLAKRKRITRLSAEIAEVRAEARQLQQRLRESSRI